MNKVLMLLVIGILSSMPAMAGFDEGIAAYDKGDYAEALSQFRPLAEQGYAEAQFNLGQAYLIGQGVPRDYA